MAPPPAAPGDANSDTLSKETDTDQVPSTSSSKSRGDTEIVSPVVDEKARIETSDGSREDVAVFPDQAEGGAEGGTDERPQRSKLQIALIMLSLGIAVLLVALDITIITTALPTIAEKFQSASGYTWIGSAYLISNSAAGPIWGKVSDIFGRKPCLLVTNVIFFIGSLLAALSVNMDMLIAARVVQGMGGGGLVVLVNITISDLFSPRERGAYFGVIGGVWALASSLGPIVGGLFTQKVSWRWCFWINLPLDGLAFIILIFFLDLHTPRTSLRKGLKAVDWLGAVGITGGTTMLLLGLEMGGITFPWKSATIICLLIFGVVVIGIFFVIEDRVAPYPLMPLDVFSKRSNLAALGACFLHSFVFISGSYYLPLYFQAVLGATPLLSGVWLLPTALSLSFVSAFTGIFIRKTGKYLPPIWAGFFIMTLGFGLFIDFGVGSSWAKIIIYQIVAGIGVGPNFQAPLIALQSLVAQRDIATATATFGFVRNLGSAISVVVGSVIFQNVMKTKEPELRARLGPDLAAVFSGGSAGASVGIIQGLPPQQKGVTRRAFADSLSIMWITYVAFSALGLGVSLLITKNVLSKEHEETKTGLEEEMKKRAERKAERALKKNGDAAKPGDDGGLNERKRTEATDV